LAHHINTWKKLSGKIGILTLMRCREELTFTLSHVSWSVSAFLPERQSDSKLPNLFVTNNPVKVTRESGTIISAEVSIGYDVPPNQVESLLKQAAEKAATLKEQKAGLAEIEKLIETKKSRKIETLAPVFGRGELIP